MPRYSMPVIHIYRHEHIISNEEVSLKIPSNIYKVVGRADAISTSINLNNLPQEWARLTIFGYDMLLKAKETLTTTLYLEVCIICRG